MGYRVVDVDAVEPEPNRPCECRKLSDPGDLDAVAINRFRAAPGEQLPLAYHAHETQQEAFYVIEGTLAVETPGETYEVSAGDLFVVDPGNPQRAYNPPDATGPVTALAVGAPPASDDVVVHGSSDGDSDPEER